jgi:Xaa-Pro aminopeptidase
MTHEFSAMPERLAQVRATAAARGLDAILFLDMQNIRYLTGFTGSDGATLVGREGVVLLVDGRYTTQAGKEAQGLSIEEYRDKMEGVARKVLGAGWKHIGIESATIRLHEYLKLKDKLVELEIVPLDDEVNRLRIIKSEGEVERIQKAAGLASRALQTVLNNIRPGMQERDIARDLEFQIRREGADRVAFDAIVASGENSAMPHARPGTRCVKRGDLIILDYGAVWDGYHSDETCTVALGPVSIRQKEVYSIVKEAHDRALAAVKAGIPCREIDRIARSVIEEKELGAFFSHGTGHGIGLCVHEEPRLSLQSDSILETGMVVTIEPGVYLPGLWGVRIEDMVHVERDGCSLITTTVAKDFVILH